MSLIASPRLRGSGLLESWRARGITTDTVFVLGGVGAFVVAAAASLHIAGGFGLGFVGFSIASYALLSAIVLYRLDAYPHPRFGAANAITAFRAGMTCMIGGLLFEASYLSEPAMEAWLWSFVAASVFALSLDGFDGYLARRAGQCSAFGARFDMEVDATLILFLSVMAYALDKAGLWVVLIGAMRHLFLTSSLFLPQLRGKLDESLRRKTICVLQIAALCIILTPLVQPPVSTAIAAMALIALAYSFAADSYALMRREPA